MPLPFSRRASQTAPSFSRDFAGLKTLDHGVGPAITFTRASNATFFDASGVLQTASNDTPRFDHDPATGASRGLLIEEARTNLFERSAEFDNAYWTKNGATVTANAAVAPNGESVADRLVESTTDRRIYRDLTAATGTAYSFSVFAKADTRDKLRLLFSTDAWTSNRIGDFQLSGSGTILATQGTVTAAITSVGSGWYRCSITATTVAAANSRHSIYVLDNDGGQGAADGTSGIYIWGAQLEAGAFPTSYIPTTAAAATRAADSAVVTPISSFYNQAEGTIYNEFSVPVLDGASTLRGISMFTENAGIQNRFQSSFRGTGLHAFAAASANVAEWDITSAAGLITAGTNNRLAMGYNMAGNHARSYNGAAVATSSTAGTTPTRERLLLGFNGSAHMNGHIRKIAYYPRRLSNTLLQQLTT
jgi:hypothetical protein